MSRKYNTKEFKDLQLEWYKKLQDSGFQDIETESGDLKTYDRRTVAFEDREKIREFFLALDSYLNTNPVPAKNKKILELYSSGLSAVEIATLLTITKRAVYYCIKKYKKLIFGI